MTHALIVVGDSRWFEYEGSDFALFLQIAPGINSKIIKTEHLSARDFSEAILKYIESHAREPVLIAYTGHGDENGWSLNIENTFLYKDLVIALSERNEATVVVNDCCCSGMLTKYFYHMDTDKTLVISSAQGEDKCTDGLFYGLQEQWSNNQVFVPHSGLYPSFDGTQKRLRSPQARFGSELDYLFWRRD